jgi:molybdopterin synthase sulfurtransferase
MTTTQSLKARAEDPRHTLLDVRPVAAYNGWRLSGEPRGGHIPGARSFPLEWTRFMDWVEVVEDKGLVPERPVTVYGYTADEGEEMARHLERLGFQDVAVYGEFAREWLPDQELPLARLERHDALVHPEWLQAVVRGEAPAEHPPQENAVLCHVHFGNSEDYEKGHIPGAISLDTNLLEEPRLWNRRTPEELSRTLPELGIHGDSTVVLYGRHSHPTYEQKDPGQSAGHLAAMRAAVILLWAGVRDVRVLNGGIHAWEEVGGSLSTEPEEPTPVADFGGLIPDRPGYMVDVPRAKELLASSSGALVSVRSWPEFVGERSGYHYIEKKGRIPGAIFGNCGSDAYHMENYRNFDYTTREFGEIRRMWALAGVVPEKEVAFYCGTGWRGSEAFLNAWLMGWPRIALFDGGWYEWSSDPDNPTETGPPAE